MAAVCGAAKGSRATRAGPQSWVGVMPLANDSFEAQLKSSLLRQSERNIDYGPMVESAFLPRTFAITMGTLLLASSFSAIRRDRLYSSGRDLLPELRQPAALSGEYESWHDG